MKVEDLLDFICKVAWTVLIVTAAAYATMSFVKFIKAEPRPIVPERIEVVITGQEQAKPEPDKAIGQKIGAAVVGQGVSE